MAINLLDVHNFVVQVLGGVPGGKDLLENVAMTIVNGHYASEPGSQESKVGDVRVLIRIRDSRNRFRVSTDVPFEVELVASSARTIRPSAAIGLQTPGQRSPFEIPRTIRPQMREALSNGPLLPDQLAKAVVLLISRDNGVAIPDSQVKQANILHEVCDLITRTIDSVEFRIDMLGPTANKIRYIPQVTS